MDLKSDPTGHDFEVYEQVANEYLWAKREGPKDEFAIADVLFSYTNHTSQQGTTTGCQVSGRSRAILPSLLSERDSSAYCNIYNVLMNSAQALSATLEFVRDVY